MQIYKYLYKTVKVELRIQRNKNKFAETVELNLLEHFKSKLTLLPIVLES